MMDFCMAHWTKPNNSLWFVVTSIMMSMWFTSYIARITLVRPKNFSYFNQVLKSHSSTLSFCQRLGSISNSIFRNVLSVHDSVIAKLKFSVLWIGRIVPSSSFFLKFVDVRPILLNPFKSFPNQHCPVSTIVGSVRFSMLLLLFLSKFPVVFWHNVYTDIAQAKCQV